MKKRKLTIRHTWALGDTVLLTALVRDLHLAYPGAYELSVDTNWSPVWTNNPHVVKLDKSLTPLPQRIEVSWGDAISWNGYAKTPNGPEMKHILAWYHYNFEQKTGIHVPVTDPRPDLHLTNSEQVPLIQGRYWVVLSGGKLDLTNKHWEVQRYQQVVNRLHGYGLRFVQCGAALSNNIHPPLDNCLNMVGKTENVRDMFNIIKHAEGVICPVTAAMHIAAAFERPCVVLSGGREEPWFEAYVDNFQGFGPEAKPVAVPHQFLHTIGLLHCCNKQGCWKKRVVPITQDDLGPDAGKLCKEPVRHPGAQAIPKCMDLITVDHVVEAVMKYYEEKILPPIGTPAGKYPEPDAAISTAEPIQKPDLQLGSPPPMIRIPTVEIQTGPTPSVAVPNAPIQARPGSLPPRLQRDYQKTVPTEIRPVGRASNANFSALDHPLIGGKYTICLLCWGPHTHLAKKCLDSILKTLPRERIDLRVACNECPADTVDYVYRLKPDALYVSPDNLKKYPTMRQMFWDPTNPINTKYTIWFDDDTQVVDDKWAIKLTETIVANHQHGCRLYGLKLYHDLMMYAKNGHRPSQWFCEADWWHKVPLRMRNSERYAPNGSCIDFAVGWFWAMATETIRTCNIPDPRLHHNGGDITIGEQVHQGGFKIKEINKNKCLVHTPTKDQGGRRVGGYEESFPWVPPNDQFAREFKL